MMNRQTLSKQLRVETLEAREVPANFAPGNLVVYRVGNGSADLVPEGSAVFLDEYTPAGTLVQSFALPTTASGSQKQLIANGINPLEGMLTRSANGETLVLTGYAANLGGVSSISGSASATVNRVIGRINAFGAIDTSTGLSNFANNNEIRGAATTNGTDIWVVGSSSGVNYTTFGSSTSTAISTTVNSLRNVNVFNNGLYAATSITPNEGVGRVGTGLPTSGSNTLTTLPGLPAGMVPSGFFFADLNPGVTGLDVLYVADDSVGLRKFSFDGTNWNAMGTVGADADDYRGLTASVNGTTVTLYATIKGGTSTTGGGQIVSLIDSTGHGGTLSGTPTVVATAGSKRAFRGIALAPVKVNSSPVNTLPATLTGNEDANNYLAGISVADADAAGNDIQVVLSVNTGTLFVNTGVAGGLVAGQITNNNSAAVTLTGTVAEINATLLNATGLRYSLGLNLSGTATLQMNTSDLGNTGTDGAKTDSDTSLITIGAVNDEPTFSGGIDPITDEDPGQVTIPNWATNMSPGPADESGQTLTFATSTNNDALFAVLPAIDPITGTLTYTPADNVSGNALVQVVLQDNGGTANGGDDTSEPQTFLITVGASNDPPTFTLGADQNVNEDSGQQTVDNFVTNISTGPANESGQELTAVIVSNDNNALFSVQPTIDLFTLDLVYTPAPNAFGTATVSVQLKDNGGTANNGTDTSPVQTFTITVNSVNDVPSFTKGANQTITEDAGGQTLTGWATGISKGPANESGQTLTFELNSDAPALFSTPPAINPTTGTLTYTPAPNAAGSTTVTVRLKDDGDTLNGGIDTSADQTFTITINPVNDAPSFVKGADQNINEDAGPQNLTGWATSINAGGPDESGQALTFEVTTNNNALFSVLPSIDANGTLTYTTATNAFGTATVSVTLKDNGGTASGGADTSGTQTFVINVASVNDTPVLDNELFYLPPSATPGYSIGTVIASDVENHTITYSIDPLTDPNGNFAINATTGEITLASLTNLATISVIKVLATDNGIPNAVGEANIDIRQNTKPVLDTTGTPMLDAIPVRGKTLPAGSLLALLTPYITDLDPGAVQGIAITGLDSTTGTWEYNLTGAANGWVAVPAVTPSNALVLADDGNTMLRFVPNAKFKGFASLTFKAWDRVNGFAEGTTQDTTGTDSSFSDDSDRAWIAVGKTTPTVDTTGRTVLKAVKEDAKLSGATPVSKLLGIAGQEALPATNLGIAVVDASTASGTWQVKLTGTKAWVNIGAVSETNALLLKPTDVVRFAPLANADTEGVLTFKTWDQSTQNTDTTVGSAFGADPGQAVVDIIALNDAPTFNLTTPAILDPVATNATSNARTFASMMTAIDVENDVNAINTGVAVYAATGEGVWQYRKNGDVNFTDFPALSTKKALLLEADTEVRFKASVIVLKPGTAATLAFKAWDKSTGTVNTQGSMKGTAFSKAAEVVSVAVANQAPVLLDGNPVLTTIKSSAKPGSGTAVKSLLAAGLTDVDNAKALKGIAITDVDNTNGQWQYSLGGNVWVNITAASLTNAILLKDSNKLRFVPNTGFTGTATMKFKGWDQTAGQAGDQSVDTTGALNSFSAFEETATITVTA